MYNRYGFQDVVKLVGQAVADCLLANYNLESNSWGDDEWEDRVEDFVVEMLELAIVSEKDCEAIDCIGWGSLVGFGNLK